MKMIVAVTLALVAVTLAAPVEDPKKPVEVKLNENEQKVPVEDPKKPVEVEPYENEQKVPVEDPKKPVEVKLYENNQIENGFKFKYELSNDSKREEQGELKEVVDKDNKPVKVITVRGSYAYMREDGTLETVEYYADESGYHAKGNSIPRNPEETETA